jgi:signal transduction histidine kinase
VTPSTATVVHYDLPQWRWARPWRLPRWFVQAGVILVAAVLLDLAAEWRLWPQSTALAAVNLFTSLAFVLTGLLLRNEAGQRGVAWVLILAGICRGLDYVDLWNAGPGPFYGLVFGALDRLFGAWALLRYPHARLHRAQRNYLVILATWMLGGRLLIAVTSTPQWNGDSAASWWPALFPDERLTDVINVVVNMGEALLGAMFIVLLLQRLTRTTSLDRIIIAPITVAGIAAVLAACGSAIVQMLAGLNSTSPNGAYLVEGIVDLALPLAFLVSVVQRALLLGNLAGLTTEIAAGADVSSVQHALRAILRDPTLDVLDLSQPDKAVDGQPAGASDPGPAEAADGEPVGTAAGGPEPPPGDRLVEFIRAETGAPIAVVIADPALARYRGLFDAAVRTSGLALKNAQLQAQAAEAELNQVRASRARIVDAALAERRRLERNLHDGAQQHLLGLAAQLTAAMARTTDPQAATAFQQARAGLTDVLAQLRDLARGIHPAVLSLRGLAAALEDVAERIPLPVQVTAPDVRVSPAIEATAYFVACEALANVVKHAGADSATVVVTLHDGRLDMEITDDGTGGICAAAGGAGGPGDGAGGHGGGHGIANMRDRVRALDGDVTFDSRPGGGTRVAVTIPCA